MALNAKKFTRIAFTRTGARRQAGSCAHGLRRRIPSFSAAGHGPALLISDESTWPTTRRIKAGTRKRAHTKLHVWKVCSGQRLIMTLLRLGGPVARRMNDACLLLLGTLSHSQSPFFSCRRARSPLRLGVGCSTYPVTCPLPFLPSVSFTVRHRRRLGRPNSSLMRSCMSD